VAAEGILWMLQQPLEYSGRRESMYHLREREGIMQSQVAATADGSPPPQELFNGLAPLEEHSVFEGMYDA
jgi:hypothetical protein